MNQDKSLQLQAEIIKVNKVISQIKELGFDTNKIERIINKLIQEVEEASNKINEDYNAQNSINNFLKEDFFVTYCEDAIKNLIILEEKLIEEYQTYSEIQGVLEAIDSNIEQYNQQYLSTMLDSMITVLEKLKHSSTIHYNDEKELVEKAYQLTYKLIKLELLQQPSSRLLEHVLRNEIDIQFTEKYLLEELNQLDITEEENKIIIGKVKELKKSGLSTNLLDLELLQLLKYANNKDFIETKKNEIITSYQQLEDNQTQYDKLEKKYKNLVKKANDISIAKKRAKQQIIKYASYITFIASLSGGIIVGTTKFAQKISSNTLYFNLKETYDVSKDELTQKEIYSINKNDKTTITKYFPYQKDVKINDYSVRKIYTYNVSDISYNDLRELANIDLETYSYEPKIYTERKSDTEILASDLYKNVRVLIERVTVDENNSKKETDILLMICISFIIDMIIVFFILGFYYDINIIGDKPTFIQELIKSIKEYNNNSLTKQELSIQLLKITQEMEDYLQESQQIISQINKVYDLLPQSTITENKLIKIKKNINLQNNIKIKDDSNKTN